MAEIIGKRAHLSDGAVPFSVVTVRADLGEGARLSVGDMVRIDTALPRSESPPLSRDALLHELARSLRATHPERAEELIAAVERAMPSPDWASDSCAITPQQANRIIKEYGSLPHGYTISERVTVPRKPHTGSAIYRKSRR